MTIGLRAKYGPGMSEFKPDDQPGRPGATRLSKTIATVILGVCVVVGAVALSFPWLDSLDQRWTTCEVIEAIRFRVITPACSRGRSRFVPPIAKM